MQICKKIDRRKKPNFFHLKIWCNVSMADCTFKYTDKERLLLSMEPINFQSFVFQMLSKILKEIDENLPTTREVIL